MKGNRLNEKVLVVVLLMVAMPINLLGWSAVPVNVGGTWYSYNENNSSSTYTNNACSSGQTFKKDVFPPCQNRVEFQYYQSGATESPSLHAYKNNESSEFDYSSFSTKGSWTDSYFTNNSNQNYLYDMYSLKITRDYSSYKGQIRNIKIKLAQHLRFYNNTDIGATSLATQDFGSEIPISGSANCTIKLRSFLTTNNLKMKIVSRDGDAVSSTTINNIFKINYLGQVYTGEVVITDAGNICGYPGAAGNRTESSTGTDPINTDLIPIYIEFHPNEASLRKARLIFYDGTESDVVASVDLQGSATKITPVFTWVAESYRTMKTNEVMTNAAATQSSGAITYKSSNTSVMVAQDASGNTVEWGTKIKAIANGTATITASVAETPTFASATSTAEFTVTDKWATELSWTQTDIDVINVKNGNQTIALTASVFKRGTTTVTGQTIQYTSSNSAVAEINGTNIVAKAKGTVTITAKAVGNSDYSESTISRTIEVVKTDCNCSQYSLAPISEISSTTTKDLVGLPGVLTGKGKWTIYIWARHYASLKITDNNNNQLYYKRDWFKVEDNSTVDLGSINVPNNATSLTFTINNEETTVKFKNIQVTQQTYFTPDNTSQINLGTSAVGNNSASQTFNISYSNLSSPITVTLSGGANSDFVVDKTLVNVTCNEWGTASFNISFKPKTKGSKTETITFTSKIGSNTQTKTVTLTGTGTGLAQSLSWNNSHSAFGTLNSLSTISNGNIDLTTAATASSELTPTYELFDLSESGVAEIVTTDNVQYLKINKAGSFKIRAKQAGNNIYDAATNIESGIITISKCDPELHWTAVPDDNTLVFRTFDLEARTNDTQGLIGAISYSKTSDNAGTLENNVITLNNRTTTTVYASIAETGTYNSKTISQTFTPSKVTPTVYWSGSEITGTTFTATTYLECSSLTATISNSDDLWHDISVEYRSSDSDVAELQGNHFYLKKEGTCQITAYVVEGGNNNASNEVSYTLTVVKSPQSITWNLSDDESAAHYINNVITLTASSPANNVTYTASPAGVVTINGNQVTCNKAGYVTITAHSATTPTYLAASDVSKDFVFGIQSSATDFGNVTVGGASTEQTFDLSNLIVPKSGTTHYNIYTSSDQYRILDGGQYKISLSGDKISRAVGESVSVKYYPLNTTGGTATLYIEDDDRTYQIPLSGTPQANTISCGDIYVGNASATTTINLTDHTGDVTVSTNEQYKFRIYQTTEDGTNPQQSITVPTGTNSFLFKFCPNATQTEQQNAVITVSETVNGHAVQYTINASGTATRREVHFASNPLGTVETETITLDNMAVGTGFTVAVLNNNNEVYRVNNGVNSSVDINTNSFDITFMAKTTNPYNGVTLAVTEKSTGQVYNIYLYGQATANSTLTFSEVAVSDYGDTQNFTVSGFAEGNFELDILDGNNASVITSFKLDGKAEVQNLVNGSHTLQFNPQVQRSFVGCVLYARDKNNNGILYKIADISASSRQKSVTLEWIDASDTITIGTSCQGNFARCVEVPNLQVYYISNDQSIIEHCDEDSEHSDNYRGVQGVGLSTTTVTAYIINSAEYHLDDADRLTKPFRVTSKTSQTIIGVQSPYILVAGSGSVTLNATAVLSSDGSTLTGKQISYAIEDYASKSTVVTLSGSTLTPVGKGTATLVITAAGDATYESVQRRVQIEVYNNGECGTQYLVRQGPFTSLGTYEYDLTKPVGELSYMSFYISTCSTVDVTVYYVDNGVTHNIVNKKQCMTAAENTWDILSDDVRKNNPLPETATKIGVKLEDAGWAIWGSYSLSELILTQKKYFRSTSTTSVNFSPTEYNFTLDQSVDVVSYSALDGIIQYEINGAQKSSFSITNDKLLSAVKCGDAGTMNLNIRFQPQTVGECNATLTLKAYVNGTLQTYDIALSGTGTMRTQTIEWTQSLDGLTVADKNTNIELTAASSIKNETLPITYTITSGGENAQLVTSEGKTYLKIVKAGSVTITATQVGTDNIGEASASRTFTIGAAEQIIAWAGDDTITINTNQSTASSFATFSAKAQDRKGNLTNLKVQYDFTVNGNCGQDMAALLDTARDANNDLTVTYKGGGSATITVTASQPGDKVNYSASTENKTKTLIIARTTPTMQWTTNELSGHYYGDVVTMTPTRTPLLGNDNTYSYTFENITNGDLVADGNVLQIKKAVSNATINANKVEDCWNTATTTPASQTVSFDKAPQLIKWNQDLSSINAGTYNTQITFDAYSIDERHSTTDAGGNNVDTWKTRNSNGEVVADGAITYSVTFVSAEAGCSLAYTLNNNVLTITDAVAGEVTVTASCAASDNYAAAAATVVKTFTIDKITPTVSGLVNGGDSVVYNPNVTYTLTGSASGDNYSSIDAAEFTYTVESGNATISGTELTTTGAGTATIRVTKAADCYVDATAGTFTVTITRATPDFAFTAAPASVAYGTTATYTAASTAVPNGTVSYEIASGSDCAEINCSTGVVTPRKVGTFTVKATLAESTNHTSAEVTTAEISIVKGTPTLTISGNETMNRYETQKLTFETDNAEVGTITLSSSNESVVSVSEHSITALGQPGATATITATMAATDNWNSQTATIGITVATGTLHFVGSENSDGTEWFNTANWSPQQVIPESADNVVIEHACVVSGNAVCNDLSFATNGSLTVDSNAVLSAGTINNNDDAGKLLLKATLNHSASVLFTSGSPKATVECWFRGKSTKTVDGNDTTMTPEWQYRGFIGNPDSTRWPVRKVLVYAWDEGTNGWDTGDNGDGYVTKGSSWTGYSMGNTTTNTMTLTYTTELIPTNEPETLNLAKSTTGKGKGLNLVTNSFSAPVLIDDITFTNATEEIVFFRTNSYENVKNELSGTGTTTEKINSLYVTCPKNTTKVLGKDTIPAGSSFFCLATATSGSSITLPVPVQSASGAMYAPRHTDEFNVLKIYAESESERDEVYLVESDNCTHNYDNGYDGTKYFTDGMGQIYGKNDFGRTFIAADSSMLGQMIGFRAGSNDMTYRLRFDIERLSGYDELYLYDRVTKRYTDILDGGTYEFIGTTDGEDERFQILGKRTGSDTFNTGSDHAIEVIADRALLKGFDGENQTIYLTDLNGTTVWSDNAQNGPWFNLPINLPAGIYIIHCGDATAKYLKK